MGMAAVARAVTGMRGREGGGVEVGLLLALSVIVIVTVFVFVLVCMDSSDIASFVDVVSACGPR